MQMAVDHLKKGQAEGDRCRYTSKAIAAFELMIPKLTEIEWRADRVGLLEMAVEYRALAVDARKRLRVYRGDC